MTIRRTLLKTFVGIVPLNLLGQNKSHALNINQPNLNPVKRDYYKELGIKPIINAAGGIITTWSNDDPKKAGNILCSVNKNIHNKLLKILKPLS